MRNNALMTKSPNWPWRLLVLVTLAYMSSLMISCGSRPPLYYTGQDYLRLSRGETYTATRPQEAWASESVIQQKDRTILELIAAVRKLQAEADLRP